MTEKELVDICAHELSLMMGIPADQIRGDTLFESLRLNSLHAMQLLDELEDRFSISISPMAFWENPTLSAFCKHVLLEIKSARS